jgi:Flp pilus assembly pilin Flp
VIKDAISRVFASTYVAATREEGQTFVEYSLIGALIAVLLAGALILLKNDISTVFTNIESALAKTS